MERLFSPWRLRYVAAPKPAPGCVFCRAIRSKDDRKSLVLHRGRTHFVILNKFPYSNGHLMVVPRAHLSSPAESEPEALLEMMGLVVRSEAALRRAYRPEGINLGMNLGRSAGAGITGHYHLHMVPRWNGDTNFMSVVHATRVIPEALGTAWRRLRPLLNAGPVVEARRGRLRAARPPKRPRPAPKRVRG